MTIESIFLCPHRIKVDRERRDNRKYFPPCLYRIKIDRERRDNRKYFLASL